MLEQEKLLLDSYNHFYSSNTYYAFKRANLTNSVSTGISLEDALIEYITEDLNGVIGEDYAAPKGRIDVNYDSLVMPLEPAA